MKNPMSKQEIDELIQRAGLSDVMDVFNSAIEIHTLARTPDGDWHDGYTALAALLASCARAERIRASTIVRSYNDGECGRLVESIADEIASG